MPAAKQKKVAPYVLAMPSPPPSSSRNKDSKRDSNQRRRDGASLSPINCNCLSLFFGGLGLAILFLLSIAIPLTVVLTRSAAEISSTRAITGSNITTIPETTTSTTSVVTTTTAIATTNPFTPSAVTCSSTIATSCTTTTTLVASCQSYEVSWNNHCYYLDGSSGNCTTAYSLATNAVLTCIKTQFVGKTYRSTISNNCCIWTADTYECYELSSNCNSAGPFSSAPMSGCTNLQQRFSQQLTFCGSN